LDNAFEALSCAYQDFKRLVRDRSPLLYEQWKAGGFLVDDDIISYYPSATKVFESLQRE
jgi:hypothetical protein